MHTPSSLLKFLSVMASVAAGFYLVLKVGFILHHDPMPSVFESIPLTGIAILIMLTVIVMSIVYGFRAGAQAAKRTGVRQETERQMAASAEARRQRVAELAADPARAKYAPLVERGEIWTDTHIAYNEDPSATVTCAHLQMIEQAMREAGISVRLPSYLTLPQPPNVQAKCRIDLAALQQDFRIAPPIRYAEFYQGERHEHDFPTAFLICDEHRSMIHVLHPEESGAQQAPIFPNASGV